MIISGATISGINIYEESPAYVFTTWTFTNVNSAGRTGPTVANLRALYNTTGNTWINDNNYFTAVNGIQYWTVPRTGTYTITARGAQGAPATATGGGLGAMMTGDFYLVQGQKLQILVGQSGVPPTGQFNYGNSSAGGGGSFVVLNSGAATVANVDLLLAAGGGGGSGNVMLSNSSANASIGLTGRVAWNFATNIAGGTAGMGGSTGVNDNGAGGGFWGNGSTSGTGGTAYRFGGAGGLVNAQYSPWGGGFGGGGSVNQGNYGRWSGGGGYSGGGATTSVTGTVPFAPVNNQPYFGGGGGSYNAGTRQYNLGNASGNFGNGSVSITYLTTTAHVTSGLVLHYDPSNSSSYPGSGTTITDLSGNSLNGTMTSVTYTDTYFVYNGSTSQVSIADNALLEPGSGSWTMEAWVRQTASGNDVVLGKFDPGGAAANSSYSIRTTGTTYYAQFGDGTGGYVNSTNHVGSLNTWYQLVYVFKNGATKTLETFVNGASIGSVSHFLPSILNSGTNLYIGSYNNGEYAQWFDGRIGITRLYNTALTAAQVLQNYNANRGRYGL